MLKGIKNDGRVYPMHLDVPGHDFQRGFGGKCFPKDLAAMISMLKDKGLPYYTLLGAENTNMQLRPHEYYEKDSDYLDDPPGQVGRATL